MLRTSIQVMSVCLALISSFFLLRGSLGLSITDIAELSKTRYGYSLQVVKNLAKQQADTKVGLSLILSSFVLQMVNLTWPMRIGDFGVSRLGVAASIVLSIIVFFSCQRVSEYLAEKTKKDVTSILQQKAE